MNIEPFTPIQIYNLRKEIAFATYSATVQLRPVVSSKLKWAFLSKIVSDFNVGNLASQIRLTDSSDN